MIIEYNETKREKTLLERGLDFRCAVEVFADRHFTAPDHRARYPEPRFVTVGHLRGRMVIVVWTHRGEARRIISMRKANEREKRRFRCQLAGS